MPGDCDSLWSDYDQDYDPEYEATCKYCGSTDVYWIQHGSRWVLLSSATDEVHHCREARTASADEFQPVGD